MSELPLLEVENLSVTFESARGRVHALDDVSLQLWPRQTLGIVGESGSGKSVLARAIMNLLPPNATASGTVRFLGRDVRLLPPQEAKHFWGTQIGMVFQDPMTSLNPTKRVGVQLAEGLRFHKNLSRSAARTVALGLLDQVHIPDAARRLDEYPHELSGGMRQRVVIAMALACEPQLLIADEPTTALDVTVQRHILDLLDELRRERDMGLVLITHDLSVVKGRADEVAVMYGGRLMERADTASLFSRRRHPYTEALIGSIPRFDQPAHSRLLSIAGRPPDVVDLPLGCRFAARCSYAQERCAMEEPALFEPTPGHRYACFYPLATGDSDLTGDCREPGGSPSGTLPRLTSTTGGIDGRQRYGAAS